MSRNLRLSHFDSLRDKSSQLTSGIRACLIMMMMIKMGREEKQEEEEKEKEEDKSKDKK